MSSIRYLPVDPTTRPSSDHFFRTGLIEAYRAVFAGPPYFEHYTPEEAEAEVWIPHFEKGIIILALDGQTVIGFGCAIPVHEAPEDVRDFLLQAAYEDPSFPINLESTWYMSELGVLESYRRRGIGHQLIMHRLHSINHRGDQHYVFRTAAIGSNSLHLYQQVGATQMDHEQDVSSSEQVIVNGSHSTKRIYLYGNCTEALQYHRPAA